MEQVWNLEVALNLFLQSLGQGLSAPMEFLSFLGTEDLFMLLLPAVYWCISSTLGLRMGLVLVSSASLNSYLKMAFHFPRPYWLFPEVKALAIESSFGLPSGHSMNAASMWGVMAASFRRTWAWVAVVLLTVLIGISRLYLGVHFPSDVLTGWLCGALTLVLFLKLEKPVWSWAKKLSLSRQILLALLSSLVLIAVNWVILFTLREWQIPAVWSHNAALVDPDHPLNPLTIDGMLTNAGTWFGMLAGAAWLYRSGGYSTQGSGIQLFLRYLIGLAGVAVLWYGLGQVFPRSEDLLSYGLRYFRYTLVGLWVAALAPVVFIRLGLAQPSHPQSVLQPAD